MSKVIIDTESQEAREYIAYLLWCADHGSKPGARSDKVLWAQYDAAAGEFLEKLVKPVPTTVYAQVSPNDTQMARVHYRSTYTGIEAVEE